MTRRAKPTYSPRRLEAFTDGVFAIAATLLVLDLTVSGLGSVTTDAEFWAGLVGLGPAILSFTISFLLLCMLWAVHARQFEFIARVDDAQLMLNTLRLFGVVLIPFTTSIAAEFEGILLGRVLLPLNFLWVVVFGYLQWARASRPHSGLTTGLTEAEGRRTRRAALSAVILGAITVVLSPLIGSFAFLAYAFDGPLTKALGGSPRRAAEAEAQPEQHDGGPVHG